MINAYRGRIFYPNSRMSELFASDLDTNRLIVGLELYAGRKIDPDHTPLISDEVQEVPRVPAQKQPQLCCGPPGNFLFPFQNKKGDQADEN